MCDLRGLGREREEVGEEENTISWSCSYDGERRQRREGGVPSPQTIAGSWEDEGRDEGLSSASSARGWGESDTVSYFLLCVAMTEVYMCSGQRASSKSYISFTVMSSLSCLCTSACYPYF